MTRVLARRGGIFLPASNRSPAMHIRKLTLLHEDFPTAERYPFNLPIFRKTDSLEFSVPVTFFIGENGTGKSTLLRAIARKFDIHIWQERSRGRYHVNPYEDRFFEFIRVDGEKVPGAFFASEIFRHFADALDEWAAADPDSLRYFGNDSLVARSHGQSHMAFYANRFGIRGLYLLDEPENALSPRKQIELVNLLRKFSASGEAQFIIATHSPILLACPGAEIFSFDEAPIRKVGYEDTDYFRIFRDFLNDRGRYLTPV